MSHLTGKRVAIIATRVRGRSTPAACRKPEDLPAFVAAIERQLADA